MDISEDKILLLLLIVITAIGACFCTWVWVFLQKQRGLPVLPVAWRKPVPWRGIDILLFFMLYMFVMSLLFAGRDVFFPKSEVPPQKVVQKTEIEATISSEMAKSEETSPPEKKLEHEVALLLSLAKDPWTIALCFFMAVIFAPLSEEIVFRMFLQGYLEKVDWRFRVRSRRKQTLLYDASETIEQSPSSGSFFRKIPWGVLPIVTTSFLFAILHFRVAKVPSSVEQIRSGMIILMLTGTISLIALFFWLRLFRRARLSDFGLVPREIPRDMVRGFVAFCAIAVPVYAIQIAASLIVPKSLAPDPLPIFVLAVAFGTVWCRTHRLASTIAMHMSLNAVSMGLAWLMFR